MRIFIDTEFLKSPKGLHLLSLGMVADGGHELYLEVPHAEVPRLSDHFWSDFVRHSVLPQFGRIADATTSLSDMPHRVMQWLCGLETNDIELNFDHAADYEFLLHLLSAKGGQLGPRMKPHHVAHLMDDFAGKAAADAAWLHVKATRVIDRHHALADAHALRARCHAIHRYRREVEQAGMFAVSGALYG